MTRPGPEAGGAMLLRREQARDVDAIRAVHEAAFPTGAEAQLVDSLRDAGDVAVSVVAAEGGAVLGHALLSRMRGPFPSVGLAPLAVLPGRQNEGIGTRLVQHALEVARNEGWVVAFVLGDPAYYRRFGFSADLARGFSSPYAGPHLMALVLAGRLPAPSGRIDYAPAFAQLG